MLKLLVWNRQRKRISNGRRPEAVYESGSETVYEAATGSCRRTLRRRARLAPWLLPCLAWFTLGVPAFGQGVTTTTVQGTVYTASGQPASGTVQISWPAFTTASGQAIAAGRTSISIGADGFLSTNLAPNAGSTPAGLYYTASYHLSDGTANTEYWTVPAAAQATIGQVRAQLMPAAQAIQAVSKSYVDQAVSQATQSELSVSGGSLTGPLYLSGDPTIPTQAADKHYVDSEFSLALPLSGGTLSGPVTATRIGAIYQVDQLPGSDFGAKLQACVNGLNSTYGGTCDARNFSGSLSMAANLTIATANATVYLPCATIATAVQIVVPAGTRNVSLHGCSTRGSSAAGGNQGGTVLLYSGSAAAIKVGDPTYAADTLGFHIDNTDIDTAAATASTAQAIVLYRAQEIGLDELYLLGNPNQTAVTLDGTGNYTGGSIEDTQISGFLVGINAIGHQATNPATTDWVNATTLLRLHIDCPTSSGAPIAGTIGVNLAQGDGNTFTGGDVENCSTALHLGANAQNNTIVGLRNENSTTQVVADAGSQYNSWITAGTMFTGKLTDNGSHNSFWDSFHHGFNSLNGDIWRSQADTTITDHEYLGIGQGNVRGRQTEYVTDVPGSTGNYQNAWLTGFSDGSSGFQSYQVEDMLNNVNRISVGQYNNGSSTNNQTVINSAGTGAIVLNGSNNAGTGGVVIGSGGATSAGVASISNAGNAQFNGTLQVGGTAQAAGTMAVQNNADAEVDYYLQPGKSVTQKGSFTYKDYNGTSQWYMVKDYNNNWSLNSAPGNIDVFKAYQSTNTGDTYIDSSNSTGHIRFNYEPGSGTETDIYSGGSANLAAAFLSPTAIKLPGLASVSGRYCLQIDNSGYITNTGTTCATGGSTTGAINSGTAGQVAVYSATGSTIAGLSTLPITAGGTGAATGPAALAALGGVSLGNTGTQTFAGPIFASTNSTFNVRALPPSISATSAVGNGAYIAGVAGTQIVLTGGSTVMSDSAITFTNADVNKLICVGPRESGQELCTTIASVTDAHDIVLGSPWPSTYGTPASGGEIVGEYGADDYAAFNAAFTMSGLYPSKLRPTTIFFPCGIYMVSQSLSTVNSPILQGAGQSCVFIKYAGTTPASITPVGSSTSVTYFMNLSVQRVADMEIHGNGYVQETVFQENGGFDDVLVDESTDAAVYLWGAVTWHGSRLALQGNGYSIAPSPTGLHLDGIHVAGPNMCESCLISSHTQNGWYIGTQGRIVFVDLQSSANNNNYDGGTVTIVHGLVEVSSGTGTHQVYGTLNLIGTGEDLPLVVYSGGTLNCYACASAPLTVNDGGIVHNFGNSGINTNNDSADPTIIDHSRSEQSQAMTAPESGGQTSGIGAERWSAHVSNGETYYELWGDWFLGNGCPTYGSGTCQVYPILLRPLASAGEHWRAVLKGAWMNGSGGVIDTTMPFEVELSDASPSVTLGNGTVVTLAENTNTSYAQANQLVLYASTGGSAEFSGSIFVWPNASAAQPTESIKVLQAQTVNLPTMPNATALGTDASGNIVALAAELAPLASPAITGVPTAPTAAAGTNTTQIATTAFVANALQSVPAWLQYLGDGSDGANTNASGNMNGEYFYTNFTVPSGNTIKMSSARDTLVIHATGTCTIAGTIEAGGVNGINNNYPVGGGGSGGSGGGTAAGTAGKNYVYGPYSAYTGGGGSAGAASGGNGGAGAAPPLTLQRDILQLPPVLSLGGAPGVAGANGGGAAGNGGMGVILICGAINFTGTIDVSGTAGGNATANNTGAGSGGGGGVVIMRSPNWIANAGTINVSGGAGGSCGSYTGCGAGGAGGSGWYKQFTN